MLWIIKYPIFVESGLEVEVALGDNGPSTVGMLRVSLQFDKIIAPAMSEYQSNPGKKIVKPDGSSVCWFCWWSLTWETIKSRADMFGWHSSKFSLFKGKPSPASIPQPRQRPDWLQINSFKSWNEGNFSPQSWAVVGGVYYLEMTRLGTGLLELSLLENSTLRSSISVTM